MFTCNKRVVVDGVLVAYAGQAIPDDMAKRLGLISEPEPVKPKRATRKKAPADVATDDQESKSEAAEDATKAKRAPRKKE